MLIRAYREFEGRVDSLKGSKTGQVRAAVLRHAGPFAIADIERDCPGVSRDMVRHVLRQMRVEGLVHVEGRGPGARWRASPIGFLNAILVQPTVRKNARAPVRHAGVVFFASF